MSARERLVQSPPLLLSSPDLGHFRASLADDAANQLVGDGHLVGLLLGGGTPALAGEKGEGCRVDHAVTERIDSVDNIDRQTDLRQLKHQDKSDLRLHQLHLSSYSNRGKSHSNCWNPEFFVS